MSSWHARLTILTTATVVSRAPQGAGHTHVMLAEAHPL